MPVFLAPGSFQKTSRLYSSLSKGKLGSILSGSKKSLFVKKPTKDVHPKYPVRTRFAPSPTGFLHMGSLRTALYNYLLAKNTGGEFLLRLEDTDQKRLVPGAEQSLYDALKWCKITYDEGPGTNEVYGPYRQSDRTKIYQKYINILLDTGHAYRCFCPKERLDSLRESAQKLQPPTTVSYDRQCLGLPEREVEVNLKSGVPFTVRFKSPDRYPPFEDLLHGKLDMQPQVNSMDVRYDDPILMKSDNLPTYHFANVVDDHLMKITHVIRGEEWLPSTPKHIALYEAFGWNSPHYVHIPLLTTTNDKKLSKRKGDADVRAMRANGILPEALINFSALFGWAPPRDLASAKHECFNLDELVQLFDLNNLTKGNAKVDDKKLYYFNKHYLAQRLENEDQFEELLETAYGFMKERYSSLDKEHLRKVLSTVGTYLTTIYDIDSTFNYLFKDPAYENENATKFLDSHDTHDIAKVLSFMEGKVDESNILDLIKAAEVELCVPKKLIFECVRFALAGSIPGVKLPVLVNILTPAESNRRILKALTLLK
ncbi:unnamed protein product [Kluyveromyces dobzhanskii CBS 2104]|uniref:Glutamate--tRNA ligase, mitochondrial n=1 Tax=Kluyveromyces dobzhanskii CBS 2104 TaxID=1427455 RepID=A0A0A8LC56_9SACH|nr:unnamed protein product [Kluyveromyces dobzhanskii CBS 2104]